MIYFYISIYEFIEKKTVIFKAGIDKQKYMYTV